MLSIYGPIGSVHWTHQGAERYRVRTIGTVPRFVAFME